MLAKNTKIGQNSQIDPVWSMYGSCNDVVHTIEHGVSRAQEPKEAIEAIYFHNIQQK